MSKVYKIGKVKQLIDLNQESTNFDASFRVVSKNKEPFEILVVNQTTLDTNPNLEYKKADGEISGRIVHDKNSKENFFIILKADKDCECMVQIDKKDLPKMPQQPPQPVPQTPPNTPSQEPSLQHQEGGTNWLKILLVLAVVVGIGFALYWFSKKSSKEDPENRVDMFTPPQKSASPEVAPMAVASRVAENPLLDRLKSLKLN